TKPHVDTAVVIAGDSVFSRLASKLRENNKTVIGIGVKNSTSDLLIANCGELIYYDALVRIQARPKARTGRTGGKAAGTPSARTADKPADKATQHEAADKGTDTASDTAGTRARKAPEQA